MEVPTNEINLKDDQDNGQDHLQMDIQPARIRNPRIVVPDDFQWWLMLEQQEQM